MTGIADRCRRARRKTVFRHLRPHFVASAAMGQHVVRSPNNSPAPSLGPRAYGQRCSQSNPTEAGGTLGDEVVLSFALHFGNIVPGAFPPVLAIVSRFASLWPSMVIWHRCWRNMSTLHFVGQCRLTQMVRRQCRYHSRAGSTLSTSESLDDSRLWAISNQGSATNAKEQND